MTKKLDSTNKFRDVFNSKIISSFARDLKKNYPDFNHKAFLNHILPKLDSLELKARKELITDALFHCLPKDFEISANILIKSLKPELSVKNEEKAGWDSFIIWPQTTYISRYGHNHFDLSMKALYEMTKRLTAEFDIRFFIENHYEKAMNLLHKWVDDQNHHVRRLVSEGTRPRLPWGKRLKRFQQNPKAVIELLEKLKSDESLYVRRSVANNINDIAKDNPDIAIALLKKWNKLSDSKVKWIVRHAARSLIKQGHPEIIELFGCELNPKISVSKIALNLINPKIGGEIEFSFDIKSDSKTNQSLIVDFVVHFQKANGKTSPKIFKLRNLDLAANSKISFSKKLSLKNMTTRKIYKGEHFIEVQVNGKTYSKEKFIVKSS